MRLCQHQESYKWRSRISCRRLGRPQCVGAPAADLLDPIDSRLSPHLLRQVASVPHPATATLSRHGRVFLAVFLVFCRLVADAFFVILLARNGSFLLFMHIWLVFSNFAEVFCLSPTTNFIKLSSFTFLGMKSNLQDNYEQIYHQCYAEPPLCTFIRSEKQLSLLCALNAVVQNVQDPDETQDLNCEKLAHIAHLNLARLPRSNAFIADNKFLEFLLFN